MPTVHDTIQAVRQDLNRVMLEREDAIDLGLLALLTRQHFLQVGGSGIAKSMLVEAICKRIVGARLFEETMTPDITAAELLGPQDLIALADYGQHKRIHSRTIVEADLLYLDEIGRSNKLARSILLKILGEERRVDERGMDAPIQLGYVSCFSASNSYLEDEDDKALNNRFLLRQDISPIADRDNRRRLLTTPPKISDIQATMTLDDLGLAQREAQHGTLTTSVIEATLDLQEQLTLEGVYISDRMFTWSGPLLRAHAWLMGNSATDLEDLAVLQHSWWTIAKDRDVVQRAVLSMACPLSMQAREYEDDAYNLIKNAPDVDDPAFVTQGESINRSLNDILTKLDIALNQSGARDKAPAIASLKKIKTAQVAFAAKVSQEKGYGVYTPSDLVAAHL